MMMNTYWRLGYASHSALLTRPMRFFSTSRLQSLKINADRLNETLHYTCQWGAANRYGE